MLFVIIGLVKGGGDVKGGGGGERPLSTFRGNTALHTCTCTSVEERAMFMYIHDTSVETIGKEHAQCICTIDDSATVTIAVLVLVSGPQCGSRNEDTIKLYCTIVIIMFVY